MPPFLIGSGLKSKLLWADRHPARHSLSHHIARTWGEPVNPAWLLLAVVCIYFNANRMYALFIASKVLAWQHLDGSGHDVP